MQHVIDNMLRRFMSVYGNPDTENVDVFLAEYARILKGYSASELNGAADRILRKHKFRTWPSIAECVNSCEEVRAKAKAEAPRTYRSEAFDYEQKRHFADGILREHMATSERAAAEGWILGLHEFVTKHGRMPSTREVDGIRETSEFVTRCAAGQVNMGACHAALFRLANSILERREKTAQRILGGAL